MKASIIIPVASAALLLCTVIAASAQDRPSAVDPKGCAPHERLQTDGKAPDGKTGDTLSDKLARSKGVICPPAGVDRDIHVTPPGGGELKIIPPPGTPGGDPRVEPK